MNEGVFIKFTSHYVTINSGDYIDYEIPCETFTSHYVTINSFVKNEKIVALSVFTSHYVTINSRNFIYSFKPLI